MWLCFFSHTAHAQVFISEVYPAPNSSESEWVELCNGSSETVSLNGQYLMDSQTTPSTIFSFSSESINPESALVVMLPSAKLNNTGDGVTLYTAGNQVFDQVNYTNAQTTKSFARLSSDSPLLLSDPTPGHCLASHFPPTPTSSPTSVPSFTPTPSSSPTTQPPATVTPTRPPTTPTPALLPTSTPQPTASPFDPTSITQLLEISEILSCPASGEREWVEFHALTNQEVDLNGWYLLDGVDNRVNLDLQVASQAYVIFELPSAILNNSGDSLRLLSPDQVVRQSLSFGTCTAGNSFSLSAGQYVASTPSPGEANQGSYATVTPTTSPTSTPSPTLPSSAKSQLLTSSIPSDDQSLFPNDIQTKTGQSEPLGQVLGSASTLPAPFFSSLTKSSHDIPDAVMPNVSSTSMLPRTLFLLSASLGGGLMVFSALGIGYGITQNDNTFHT